MSVSAEKGAATGRRVAVPCCSCGRPTSMRVPAELLEEIDVLHLCTACVRSPGPLPPAPLGRD